MKVQLKFPVKLEYGNNVTYCEDAESLFRKLGEIYGDNVIITPKPNYDVEALKKSIKRDYNEVHWFFEKWLKPIEDDEQEKQLYELLKSVGEELLVYQILAMLKAYELKEKVGGSNSRKLQQQADNLFDEVFDNDGVIVNKDKAPDLARLIRCGYFPIAVERMGKQENFAKWADEFAYVV